MNKWQTVVERVSNGLCILWIINKHLKAGKIIGPMTKHTSYWQLVTSRKLIMLDDVCIHNYELYGNSIRLHVKVCALLMVLLLHIHPHPHTHIHTPPHTPTHTHTQWHTSCALLMASMFFASLRNSWNSSIWSSRLFRSCHTCCRWTLSPLRSDRRSRICDKYMYVEAYLIVYSL